MKKVHHKSLLLKLAAVVFAGYIVFSLVYLSVQIKQSENTVDELHSQIAEINEQNEQTKRVLSQDDEKFMESVARNDLGYVKPNERVFVDASGN